MTFCYPQIPIFFLYSSLVSQSENRIPMRGGRTGGTLSEGQELMSPRLACGSARQQMLSGQGTSLLLVASRRSRQHKHCLSSTLERQKEKHWNLRRARVPGQRLGLGVPEVRRVAFFSRCVGFFCGVSCVSVCSCAFPAATGARVRVRWCKKKSQVKSWPPHNTVAKAG